MSQLYFLCWTDKKIFMSPTGSSTFSCRHSNMFLSSLQHHVDAVLHLVLYLHLLYFICYLSLVKNIIDYLCISYHCDTTQNLIFQLVMSLNSVLYIYISYSPSFSVLTLHPISLCLPLILLNPIIQHASQEISIF